jgi:hypothetical protein
MMRIINRVMTALFGPQCVNGCGHRVYPKDRVEHQAKHCIRVEAV